MEYEDKINILKNQTYYYLFFNDKLINSIVTEYPILEILISHEYHQDPEWQFLKMSEEEYLKDELFAKHWTKEMKEGLIKDIDELIVNSDEIISSTIEKMGAWGGGPKQEIIRERLLGIKKAAYDVI